MPWLRPLQYFTPDWTGRICLRDGTEVYKDFEDSTETEIRGVYFKGNQRIYGHWDANGNSIIPDGKQIFGAELTNVILVGRYP